MALIALVGASEMLPDGGLRALVAIAGETLIERQAARLADVGVTHIAVAVAAVPIGQATRYVSPGLQVRPGQRIEVRIAASLRQSSTVVRDP